MMSMKLPRSRLCAQASSQRPIEHEHVTSSYERGAICLASAETLPPFRFPRRGM
jgi:hypothetical protein